MSRALLCAVLHCAVLRPACCCAMRLYGASCGAAAGVQSLFKLRELWCYREISCVESETRWSC